ncbi:MAG TPA: hypothetical protein VFU43_01130 [Streptosporangiaceae bacterium]|nr:hypothetical protein [Streptosporangiaceae bacterium]
MPKRSALVLGPIIAIFLIGGCGGDSDAEVEAVARPILTEAIRSGVKNLTAPLNTWVDVTIRKIELADVTVQRADEGQERATVRAAAKITMRIAPHPQAASLVRILPVQGLDIATGRSALVDLIQTNERWTAVQETVEVSETPTQALPQADSAQASAFATRAVTALLSFSGDIDTYNRAQEQYYATRAGEGLVVGEASDEDSQSRLDAPPHLARQAESTRSDADPGTVWARRKIGEPKLFQNHPELPLKLVLDESDLPHSDCESFSLKHMSVTKVTPELSGERHDLRDSATAEGDTDVETGQWEKCNGGFLSEGIDTIRSAKTKVLFRLQMARLRTPGASWFITQAALGSMQSTVFPILPDDSSPNLYETGA